jgi:hypothetical protein
MDTELSKLSGFVNGGRYRHPCATTLDIKVLKVSYVGETYIKLKILYVNQLTGEIFQSNPDNVRIQKEELQYWRRVW